MTSLNNSRIYVDNSIWNSVWESIRDYVKNSVEDSAANSVNNSVWDPVLTSIGGTEWKSLVREYDFNKHSEDNI